MLDQFNLAEYKGWYFLYVRLLSGVLLLFVDELLEWSEEFMYENSFELNSLLWVYDEDLLE